MYVFTYSMAVLPACGENDGVLGSAGTTRFGENDGVPYSY